MNNSPLFELASSIVEMQATAFRVGQHLTERDQLIARKDRSRKIGNRLMEIARLLDEVARDCHDDAQRTEEQLEVVKP